VAVLCVLTLIRAALVRCVPQIRSTSSRVILSDAKDLCILLAPPNSAPRLEINSHVVRIFPGQHTRLKDSTPFAGHRGIQRHHAEAEVRRFAQSPAVLRQGAEEAIPGYFCDFPAGSAVGLVSALFSVDSSSPFFSRYCTMTEMRRFDGSKGASGLRNR